MSTRIQLLGNQASVQARNLNRLRGDEQTQAAQQTQSAGSTADPAVRGPTPAPREIDALLTNTDTPTARQREATEALRVANERVGIAQAAGQAIEAGRAELQRLDEVAARAENGVSGTGAEVGSIVQRLQEIDRSQDVQAAQQIIEQETARPDGPAPATAEAPETRDAETDAALVQRLQQLEETNEAPTAQRFIREDAETTATRPETAPAAETSAEPVVQRAQQRATEDRRAGPQQFIRAEREASAPTPEQAVEQSAERVEQADARRADARERADAADARRAAIRPVRSEGAGPRASDEPASAEAFTRAQGERAAERAADPPGPNAQDAVQTRNQELDTESTDQAGGTDNRPVSAGAGLEGAPTAQQAAQVRADAIEAEEQTRDTEGTAQVSALAATQAREAEIEAEEEAEAASGAAATGAQAVTAEPAPESRARPAGAQAPQRTGQFIRNLPTGADPGQTAQRAETDRADADRADAAVGARPEVPVPTPPPPPAPPESPVQEAAPPTLALVPRAPGESLTETARDQARQAAERAANAAEESARQAERAEQRGAVLTPANTDVSSPEAARETRVSVADAVERSASLQTAVSRLESGAADEARGLTAELGRGDSVRLNNAESANSVARAAAQATVEDPSRALATQPFITVEAALRVLS